MNCEQVEARLSAYLDGMLVPDERRAVTIHLQTCPRCTALLAELRQNDLLLARLPRVSPSPALSQRIFSEPEVAELVAASHYRFARPAEQVRSLRTTTVHELIGNAQLRSLERERAPETPVPEWTSTPLPFSVYAAPTAAQTRKKSWSTPLKIAVAAVLLVALGATGLFGLSLRQQAANSANTAGAITPPAGPATGQAIPLAAGTRSVFLRNGALWSTLTDGNGHQPERLTPGGVTVAAGWVVSPKMPGHAAGDMLAYIDLQEGRVHTLRSDGQQDTIIPQDLLKTGNNNSAIWQSALGKGILSSLAWSPNGAMLAFVGDPAGDAQTSLYLYTRETGRVQKVSPGLAGSVSRPGWSPDGTRLTFEVAHDGVISILDYHLQNQEALNLSNLAASQGDSAHSVLTLGWSLNANMLAVTWSLGSIGHISSVWVHRVGADSTLYPQLLAQGDYLQALYSPSSAHGAGSWLLVAMLAGQAGDIWRLDLTPGAGLIPLSRGKQVSFARWSPDGATIFYLDGESKGIGNGHLVNALNGIDQLFSSGVAIYPAPDWSTDGQQLAYSTGTSISILNALNVSQIRQLRLQGAVNALTWSPAATRELLVALSGATSGLYLVDTQRNTSLQLDRQTVSGPIQWSEIP